MWAIFRSISLNFLSSHRKPKALFLISAFKSIINIPNKFLSFFVENIFKSIDYIGNVKCPILFIHGKADDIISHKHSEDLFQKTEKNNINNGIKLIEGKGHNNLNLKEDIIDDIMKFCFLKKLLENKSNEILLNNINIIKDEDLYIIPLVIRKFLESKIFYINEFVLETKIDKKNVSLF